MSVSADNMCLDHPEERLRFVCLDCDGFLVCRDCKLTEHEGHKSIDIAKATTGLKDKLDNHRSRLQQRLSLLQSVRGEVDRDQETAKDTVSQLEHKIQRRVAKLRTWLRQAEQTAFDSLRLTASRVKNDLQGTSNDLDRRMGEMRAMMREVDSMISGLAQSGDPNAAFSAVSALRLEQDMRTGRGRGENLEKLTESLPSFSVSPMLQRSTDSDLLSERAFQGFLGTSLYTQVSKSIPKVALSPVFLCTATPGACVSSICPMPDGTVWVAHDVVEGNSNEQRVALYNTNNGEVLTEQKMRGRVTIARAGSSDWVYCVGKNVKKMLNRHETREAISERDDGGKNRRRNNSTAVARVTCSILSKLNVRYLLKYHYDADNDDDSGGSGGSCGGKAIDEPTYINKSDSLDRRAKGAEEPDTSICKVETKLLPTLWVTTEQYFAINCRMPQAIDGDSSGTYFAVLTPVPTPSVELYEHKAGSNPVSRYAPQSEEMNFCPADLCFTFVEGKEVLVVADWYNSALHMLAFLDEKNNPRLSFKGNFLGAGCPLLKQPTALVSDDDHQLWIGCKGGQILMCIPCGSMSGSKSDSDDEGDAEIIL